MTKTKNKIFSTLIILIFAISATVLASVQTTEAQSSIATYAFLSCEPNPVGVGQSIELTYWLNLYPPYIYNGSVQIDAGHWQGWTISVTDPAGTKTTLTLAQSDYIGSGYKTFTPDKIGTYTFQLSYPGQTITYVTPSLTYGSSSSPVVSVTVQQQPISSWPAAPLPTGFWTFPINSLNREWKALAGSWLMGIYGDQSTAGASFNPYGTGPNTAHILWTTPNAFGGIVGGQFGDGSYYTGTQYEMRFTYPIIINGRLFYDQFSDRAANTYPPGFNCVDLATGKQVYSQNGTVNMGQILDFNSINQDGEFAYLWDTSTTTWKMYDAFTGALWLSITGAPAAPANTVSVGYKFDSSGNLLVYQLGGAKNWLSMWNSTYCILRQTPYSGGPTTVPGPSANPNLVQSGTSGAPVWRPPYGATLQYYMGIEWNVTEPAVQQGPNSGLATQGWLGFTKYFSDARMGGVILCTTGATVDSAAILANQTEVAYSATTGAQLWNVVRTLPAGTNYYSLMGPVGGGVYTEFIKNTEQWYAYSLTTGNPVWGPTTSYNDAWGMYNQECSNIAYGKLYAAGYDGLIHCFDLANGNLLWTASSGNSGTETPYGTWPFHYFNVIADGKVYAVTGEHSATNPLWHGEAVHVYDANTGKEIWNLAGWFQGGTPAVADGYFLGFNLYDMSIYCINKGLSATTVNAPLTGVAAGGQVTITGTVTDQSPGQTCLGIPAAGTPAIADAFMTPWMQYLYEQQPEPANATGVQVQLAAIDSSGTSTPIGTVTSDITGMYATSWNVPSAPGLYKIVANFAGTNSYYSSSAIGAITVVDKTTPLTANDVAQQVVSQLPTPVPATPAPTIPSASDVANQVVSQLPSMTTTDMILITAIVVAILIGVVNLVLLLRKKQA